jgi:hypothetical protein
MLRQIACGHSAGALTADQPGWLKDSRLESMNWPEAKFAARFGKMMLDNPPATAFSILINQCLQPRGNYVAKLNRR